MAKHASVLRQFTVETVQYDGWMELAHRWRECDWTADIDGDRITDLMRQATAHAKVCDGKPQPKPEPQPGAYRNSYMSALWASQIKAALEAHLVMPGPVQPAEELSGVVHVESSFAEIDRLMGEDPDDRAIREAHGFSFGDDWQDESLLCRNGCGISYPEIVGGKIRECSGMIGTYVGGLEHDRLMIFGPSVPRTDAPGA